MNLVISQNFAPGLTHQRREEILKKAAAKKLKISIEEINPHVIQITTNQTSGLIEFKPTITPIESEQPNELPRKRNSLKKLKTSFFFKHCRFWICHRFIAVVIFIIPYFISSKKIIKA